ncbi:RusA family crossover junction endodeoxyribonuclease [Lysinibacillus sp. 3P01SB]|uniref:RusA family crossover junction endodeoxyribonuclease n=1 Tax=Lysinibacillus sp. 3P01SB TaxID=3132284 RepID=UPI0039A65051
MIQFTVPGPVQAQERPWFSRVGKGVRTHDAPKSKSYKELVKLVAWDNKPKEPISGAIKLTMDCLSSPTKKPSYKAKTGAYSEWRVKANEKAGL